MSTPQQVLFVCVSNRGKSVMAEYLTPTVTDRIAASSAGTNAKIGGQVNELSAQVLAEVGADVAGHEPRQLTDELMRAADLV
ncbi:low molecular weight phosphatase family protein, partial [Gordonia alkanivorans]